MLEEQIDSVHKQMVEVQALRIGEGNEPGDVRKWSLEIEKQVAEYEEITHGVRRAVKDLREEALREAKCEEKKAEAQFELDKWHSNVPALEASSEQEDEKESYAKEQLGVKPGETKMLGLL